jgi:O-antigen/teichoic acid export membrane protein
MEEQDKRLNLSRPFEVLIGLVTGVISIALFFLSYLLLDKDGFLTTVSDPKAVTILSIPASFAIFFSIITYKLLITRNRLKGEELMSKNGWLTMTILMFIIAVSIAIIGHWIGSIFPAMIGIICLIREPKFRKLMNLKLHRGE